MVRGLISVVMGREAGGLMAFAVMQVIMRRAARASQTISRLLAQMRAGTLRPERAARVRVARDAPAGGVPRVLSELAQIAAKLPRGFGWLVKLIGYQAAGYGSQLAHALEDPEMAALLAASPRAVRALLPLGRMLGVAIPGTPPRAPRAKRARKPRAPRKSVASGRPRRIASWHYIPTGGGVGMEAPPRPISKTRRP